MKNDVVGFTRSTAGLVPSAPIDAAQRALSRVKLVGAAMTLALIAVVAAACDHQGGERATSSVEGTLTRPKPTTPAPSVVTAPVVDPTANGTDAAETPRPALALSAEGLELVDPTTGVARHVLFGSDLAPLITVLNRVQRAAPERAHNDECGPGPLEFAIWPGGLNVLSQQGKFVGWSVNHGEQGRPKPTLATLSGIGIGSTRSELEAAYTAQVTETTLGTEFAAGELYGVLGSAKPDARITAMWAGASCVFR